MFEKWEKEQKLKRKKEKWGCGNARGGDTRAETAQAIPAVLGATRTAPSDAQKTTG